MNPVMKMDVLSFEVPDKSSYLFFTGVLSGICFLPLNQTGITFDGSPLESWAAALDEAFDLEWLLARMAWPTRRAMTQWRLAGPG